MDENIGAKKSLAMSLKTDYFSKNLKRRGKQERGE